MSLADDIDGITAVSSIRCRTCVWYAQQDDDVKTAFNNYIARQDPEYPAYKPLWELCCRHGLQVASKTFRDHINNHHAPGEAA